MNTRSHILLGALVASATVLLAATPSAQALTMQECSAKYKSAQSAGTLGSQKWNDFRKAQCGSEATAAATTTEAPKEAPKAAEAAKPATPAKTAAKETKSAAPATSGPAVFPTAVAPKYSSETAGKARMHTCVDQYNANKATNANGGMKWIEKGGGYYSECTKKLKA